MPTIGNFAITEPNEGELRVFFSGSAGGDRVRAITISKKAHNNLVVDPSLKELNFLKASVQAPSDGGISKFIPLTRSDKGTYFFFTNQEFIIDTASGSISSSVVLDPFLQDNFANTAFNPLISNAEFQRESRDKFDVDREAGFTTPTNISALTGVKTVFFTDFDFGEREGLNELTSSASYPYTLNFTSSKQTFQFETTELPINLKLTKNEIIEVFGIPAIPNVSHITRREVDPLTGTGINVTSSLALYDFSVKVEARVLKSGSLGVGGHQIANHTIYQENYVSSSLVSASYGNTTFSGSGFDFNVTAFNNSGNNPNVDGSLTIQARLQFTVTNKHAGNSVSGDKAQLLQPISNTANKDTKNFLEVLAFPNVRLPYATKANIPDSNYTSIGFSNARYNGTKTSAANFSGVSPAIGASTFKGIFIKAPEGLLPQETFSSSSTVDSSQVFDFFKEQAISASKSPDRTVDLFFDGSDTLPIVTNQVVAGKIATPALTDYWSGSSSEHVLTSTSDTEFILDSTGFVGLEIGDIIGFASQTNLNQNYTTLTERAEVVDVQPVAQTLFLNKFGQQGLITFPNTNTGSPVNFSSYAKGSKNPEKDLFRITIKRGIYSTVKVSASTTIEGRPIIVLKGDRVFTIEGSRAIAASNKFIALDAENIESNISDETFRVISTDDRGFVNNSFVTRSIGGVTGNSTPHN